MKQLVLSVVLGFAFMFSPHSVQAASKNISVKGKVSSGEGYHVVLIDGSGGVSIQKLGAPGTFTFRTKKLRGATLALLDTSGIAYGPIVLSRATAKQKAYLGFSGKTLPNKKSVNIGNISLYDGYAFPSKGLKASLVSKSSSLVATTDTEGNPVGAASGGIAAVGGTSAKRPGTAAEEGEGLSSPGADSDSDGIIDPLDPDVDGDGTANIVDPDFRGNDDATFSGLFLDYNNTLNANIGAVTNDAIDAIVSGENLFSIGFWFSLPPESPITGGHVVCADSNPYCNRSSGVAVYSGLTESNPALQGQLWRDINTDESGYPNLEFLSVGGGNAVAGAIQPRTGTSGVRPGDTFLVNYTRDGGSTVESKLLVLSPYMVTVPALKSYTVSSTETNIDYSNVGSTPGSFGNPIVTDGDGNVTFTFWRPQRLLYRSETPASESDRYRDMGYLSYGITFEGLSRQFTCGGLYSGLSSDLTEASDILGGGTSPFPDEGAKLYPLKDGAGDATPSTSRTLSFTVNLRTCLTRAGQSVGTYTIGLRAEGEELSGGTNSASQQIRVQVQ